MKEMIYKTERTVDVLEDSTYKNYHYVVLSLGTHPCGYVEVPKSNKLYGLNMDRLPDIDCHGGVTYTRSYLGLDNNSKAYKDSWFIGWDYAHYMDYTGGLFMISDVDNKKWTTAEIVAECKSVIDQLIEYEKGVINMKDINIKSCPFCGEIPQSKIFRRSSCIEFIISCRKCDVSMKTWITNDSFTFDNIHEVVDEKMYECIKMWNTRSDPNVIIWKGDDNETDRC